MFHSRLFRIFLAAVCLLNLSIPAFAAEIDCDSIYCFSSEDFAEEVEGICITALPDSRTGTVFLGNRVVRTGDILTLEQASQMTFAPLQRETDQNAQVQYLPIFSDRVEDDTVMTITIRGKEDKAPVAEDFAAETYKNLPATGKLKVHDPEEKPMTFTVTRQPKRGTVTINEEGSFTYTPKKNKVGVDSFAYTAADPAGNVSREATVTLTILKPSDSTQYTDTIGQDCRFAAEWMKHTGIFVGETVAQQPCFQPDQEVSRGEFVTMLVKALDIPVDEYLTYTGYHDKVPQWLQPYLAAAIRSGATAGLPYADTFAADTPITGVEVSVLLQNALDLADYRETMAESGDIPEWAVSALHSVQAEDFALDPHAVLTRADAANILYQASRLAAAKEMDTLK